MLGREEIQQEVMARRMQVVRSFKAPDTTNLEKGKKVPIGTVTNGKKKVAEGKWVNENMKGEKMPSMAVQLNSAISDKMKEVAMRNPHYSSAGKELQNLYIRQSMNTVKEEGVTVKSGLKFSFDKKDRKWKSSDSKSKAASKVLQGMDNDMSYQEALKKVLSEDSSLDKKTLEKELDRYI